MVIDNYLDLNVAQKLASELSELSSTKRYKVQGNANAISAENFACLTPEQQFFRYETFDDLSSDNLGVQHENSVFSLFIKIMASQKMISFLENFYPRSFTEIGAFRAYAYREGDFLNKHNDYNGLRKIAWIYSLSQGWKKSDGGLLTFENFRNKPTQCIPTFNQLVLFEVSKLSYHSVSKVTSPSKSRLSIGGWYR